MDRMSDIVSSSQFLAQRDSKEIERDLDPMSVLVVNRLFNFFEAICPGFEKQYAGNEKKLKTQKIHFTRAFMDESINDIKQIEFGIKRCRRESPINTPTIGQFLDWCKPTVDDLGLLCKEKAFDLSSQFMREGNIPDLSEDQNLLMKHVIGECGTFFLKTNSIDKAQPVFYRNYEIAIRDFISGKLKAIPKGLEDRTSDTQETKKKNVIAKKFDHLSGYEQCMPEIRRILGMNPDGTVNK
jgi:hypothetical protein